MPDKNVRVRMETTGGDASRRDIERTSAAADEFGKKDVKAKIGIFSKVAEGLKEATGQLKMWGDKKEDATIGVQKSKDMDPELAKASEQVDAFGKKREDATVGVHKADDSDVILGEFTRVLHDVMDKHYKASLGVTDSEGRAQLIDFHLRLKKVAEGVHNAKVGIDGERKALADIYRLDAALDKFGKKREKASIGTNSSGSGGRNGNFISDIFGGLFGRGGGGSGGGGGESSVAQAGDQGGKSFMTAFSTGITSSGVVIQTVLISALILAIAATLPAIVPAAIALGVGMGGLIFGAMGKSKASKEFKSDLMSAFNSIKTVVTQAAEPLLKGFLPVLKQLGGFVRSMAPQLKAMFLASLPALKMFVNFLERSARVLIPAFTLAMHQLQPALPMLEKALMAVVRGFVGFLHALGPTGIKSAMSVLLQIFKAFGTLLVALGHTASWLARTFVKGSLDIRHWWNDLAHWFEHFWQSLQAQSKKVGSFFVSIWNSVYHAGANVVHALMVAWQDFDHALHASTNAVYNFIISIWHGLNKAWQVLVHALKTAWDTLVNSFKATWNGFWGDLKTLWAALRTAWKNIVNAMHSAWQDVITFFKNAWNSFWNFLKGVWNDLKNVWKSTTSFLRSAWQDVVTFFKNLWNNFWGFLKTAWTDLRNGWKSLSSDLKQVWGDVTNFFKSAWNTFWGFLKSVWNDLKNTWNNVTSAVKAAWHDVETFLVSSWNRIKSIASTVWGEIRHAVAVPVAFIVNDIWDPFAHAVNAALNFLHLGKNDLPTPTIKMATGGVVPGPPVKHDIVPAMLTPGERVLSLGQVAMMGGHAAIDSMVGRGTGGPTHFAGGGVVGGRQGDRPVSPDFNKPSGGFLDLGNIIHDIEGIDSRLLHTAASGALTIIDKLGPIAGSLIHGMDSHLPASGFTNMAEGLIKKVITEVAANIMTTAQNKLGVVGSGTGAEVAKYAASYATGKSHPYVFGGSSPHGWDCSGFAAWVYEKFGFFKERQGVRHGTSESQFHDPLLKPASEQPGALVFFNTHDGQPPPSHVGIVVRKGFYAGADDPAVGTIVSSDAGNMGFRIPKAGFGTASSGPAPAGLMSVAKFLVAHGFTRAAAAGIAGTVAGESGGNPESVGSGGGGLIGWTPISSAYPVKNIITGNVQRDMGNQLTDMLAYIERNGSISDMNRYTNPIAAADHFSQHYERPAVTNSDVRPSEVMSIFRQLAGAGNTPGSQSNKGNKTSQTTKKHLANGGLISEPVFGMGLRTGASYSLGENEPEFVTPLRNLPGGHGGGDCIHITVAGDTDPDAAAVRIQQKLRRLKKKRGGAKLGLD